MKKQWLPRLALLGSALLFGSTMVVTKLVLGELGSLQLLCLRAALGAAMLGVVFWRQVRRSGLRAVWHGLVMAIFLFSAYELQNIALETGMPGKCGFLGSIYCLYVPFLMWAITRKSPGRRSVIAVLVCGVGVALVSLTEAFSIERADWIALVGGLFFAFHMVAVKRLCDRGELVPVTFWQFFFTAVFGLAGVAITGQPFPALRMPTVCSVLYLGVACTGVGMTLQNYGQSAMDPSDAALILSLETVFGEVMSIAVMGEALTPRMALGFALIFGALLYSQRGLPQWARRAHWNGGKVYER